MTTPNNEYEYDQRLFDSLKTFLHYQARHKAETNGYTKWMLGRRASEHWGFARAQERNLHFVALATQTHSICVCGLASATTRDLENPASIPEPGHWSHRDSRQAQVFIWYRTLFCAGCDLSVEAELDEDNAPKADWDALNLAHAKCGFGRFSA